MIPLKAKHKEKFVVSVDYSNPEHADAIKNGDDTITKIAITEGVLYDIVIRGTSVPRLAKSKDGISEQFVPESGVYGVFMFTTEDGYQVDLFPIHEFIVDKADFDRYCYVAWDK